MTDLAIPTSQQQLELSPGQDANLARLAEWVRTADAVYTMATKIVQTSFVPEQYRGKPHEATAAILSGTEMGLGPMAALRAFDPIGGTPAPKAITLRAIAQSCGHEVRIIEESPTKAVVTGRRKGESEWQTATWTIDRATQAGYTKRNPNYQKDPQSMLVARATAQVCRWIASDAIMGMPYSAEELQDSPEIAAAPVQKVTAAEILGQQPPAEPQQDAAEWPEPAPIPSGEEAGDG